MLPSINDIFNAVTLQSVDKKDASGETRLYRAVRQGSVAEVRKLLREGANPNVRAKSGLTPLHQAAYWGESTIVDLLLKAGANVNADNGAGWTPLHSAAISGGMKARGDIIGKLLKAGAKDNVPDKHGWSPCDYMMLWAEDAGAAAKLQEFLARELTTAPEQGRKQSRTDTKVFKKH